MKQIATMSVYDHCIQCYVANTTQCVDTFVLVLHEKHCSPTSCCDKKIIFKQMTLHLKPSITVHIY
uniref:Uncharacterized protein n=2 Tax=Anguilla anguilla TaxID=7936 RepID=A0A0E9P9X4_ANGAN